MEKRKSIFRVISYFFAPYKRRFIAVFILSLLIGGMEAINIAAIYPMLSVAFDTTAKSGNIIISLIGAIAALMPVDDKFIAYGLVFIITALMTFALKVIFIRISVKLSAVMIGNNQVAVFKKFVTADYQYFVDHKQGTLIYNAATAPQKLSGLSITVNEIVSQLILSIFIVAFLFTISWQGTLAVIVLALLYHFFIRNIGEKVSYYAGRGEMEAVKESNVILNEVISGIKQVKVFASIDDWINRFAGALNKRWVHYIRQLTWQQIQTPAVMLVLYSSIAIIAVLAKIITPISFTAMLPVFGTFAFAVFRLVPIMGIIGNNVLGVMAFLPDCETVLSILSNRIASITDGHLELKKFKSEIRFDNVTFAYKGRSKILEDVSITFERGKTTAIVGRSGSGKTTLINLMLRLFEPDKGEIKIDGVDLKELKLASWLDKLGLVSQDTFIFNDTVKNNITFQSAKYSDEEVMTVARYAEAHDFIMELPDGYSTHVGDRGLKLSGGQAQRIAVARAMVRQPEILIFDEATNALDNISEAAVQKSIDEISKDHTVIIVAHRLSTVVNADKIIVLGDGRVVEEGTHQDLIAKRGAYWELYRSQSL